MTELEQRQVVPIFETKGNRFFVNWKDFVGADADEAWKIAVGASLVECILWGAHPTWETLDVTDGVLHRKSWLNEAPISIISGPLFEEALSTANEEGP